MQSTSKTYRQLQPEDRVTLASLHQQGLGVRAIARVLKRAPATVSRELRRNACEGLYASAHGCRQQHRRRARPARKLDVDGVMFGVVRHCLGLRWSPEQIALTLASTYPKGHAWRVSHETIYNCIYAQPVGELRRELLACLRQARNKRAPRGKGKERRGQIADMLSIHVRPPEVEDRQFPGHWEGELIKGAVGASAVGTLVERTSRLLMLARLPHPKPASAQHVLQAFTDKLNGIAQPMRKTLTHDQGREMARHKELTASTGIAVYFCDPYGLWQRGSNENSNYPEPAFRPGSLRFTALKGGVSNQSQFTIMHPRLEASSIQVKLRKKFRSFTCH